MIENLEGVPGEVWLESEDAVRILQQLFKALSIRALKVDELPIMNEVKQHMYSMGL